MKSDSLLQILEVIFNMFNDLMKNLDSREDCTPLKRQKEASKLAGNHPPKDKNEDPYLNLEKVLQKYEADIRNHIRVEQQLKIYTDSIQEAFDEKEKKMSAQIKSLEADLKVIVC